MTYSHFVKICKEGAYLQMNNLKMHYCLDYVNVSYQTSIIQVVWMIGC